MRFKCRGITCTATRAKPALTPPEGEKRDSPPLDTPIAQSLSGGRRFKCRFPALAIVLVFALPWLLAVLFYVLPDHFHWNTVNRGVLMQPVAQASPDPAHRWQIVWVEEGVCTKRCRHMLYQLTQMTKLLGKDQNRVVVTRVGSFFNQSGGRIYLVDPIGNIFMYYSQPVDVMGIYKDLKRLLSVSQVG